MNPSWLVEHTSEVRRVPLDEYGQHYIKTRQSSRPVQFLLYRQHNGEITQGAWRTKQGRPWVMQMIVHGFPSKLVSSSVAALYIVLAAINDSKGHPTI